MLNNLYGAVLIRLLCRDEMRGWRLRFKRISDDLAHRAPALATVEFAAMVGLHGLGATRACVDRFADTFFIYSAADANDHANHLQQNDSLVKNDSQFVILQTARIGWPGSV